MVITCTAPSTRGMKHAELTAAARAMGCDEVVQRATVEQAIDLALRGAAAEDAIVVTGSLYIVGAGPGQHLLPRRPALNSLSPQSQLYVKAVKRRSWSAVLQGPTTFP